jgi:hypothetical protein
MKTSESARRGPARSDRYYRKASAIGRRPGRKERQRRRKGVLLARFPHRGVSRAAPVWFDDRGRFLDGRLDTEGSLTVARTGPEQQVPPFSLPSSRPVPASQDCFQWIEGDFAPREEARGLFILVRRNASSVEAVRDLIAVPPRIEAALQLYMSRHPEDARGSETCARGV